MKKYVLWPLLAAIGGVGAFLLRLLQRSTGFEVDTGLPIPGNLYAILLVAGSWFWRQSACWWPGPFCLRTERTHPSFPQASPWLPPGCSLRR